jgi:ArsR family transcriptional regulator
MPSARAEIVRTWHHLLQMADPATGNRGERWEKRQSHAMKWSNRGALSWAVATKSTNGAWSGKVNVAETGRLPVLRRAVGERCCTEDFASAVPVSEAEQLTTELETVANPIRLRLLSLLAASPGPVCVCDLEAAVPVKQPTVSHHLKVLRVAGLVSCEKRGLWAYYSIQRAAVERLRTTITAGLDRLLGGDNG